VNQPYLPPDVGEGNVDVGITGIDVVEESNVDVDTILVR
jgi:ATP phosphoribosyltransferase